MNSSNISKYTISNEYAWNGAESAFNKLEKEKKGPECAKTPFI